MEIQTQSNEEIKDTRIHLESRIQNLRNSHLGVIASLQTIIPDIVPSLDLSLKVLSSFNGRPFTPIPTPLPNLNTLKPKHQPFKIHHRTLRTINNNSKRQQSPEVSSNSLSDKLIIDESGGPLSVVRSMVAVSLLQRVPFLRIDSSTVLRKLENDQSATAAEKAALRELGGESGEILAVEMALRSMAEDNGGVELEEFVVSGKSRVAITSIDRSRLVKELPESKQQYQHQDEPSSSSGIRNHNQIQQLDIMNGVVYGMPRPMPMSMLGDVWMGAGDPHLTGFPPPHMFHMPGMGRGMMPRPPMHPPPIPPSSSGNNSPFKSSKSEEDEMKDLEILLSKKSFKELQKSKTGEELLDLIHRPTSREISNAAKFKSKGGSQVKEYCSALTKEDCRRQSGSYLACEKVHFRRIIALHTDVNLGDCSFLDTCRHMKTCKYVHYELDTSADHAMMMMGNPEKSLIRGGQRAEYCSEIELGESQYINCDIRNFRMDILGQYGVIMADPPWDIHMELPYGTMADDEMRNLNVPALQTDGLIFLWVTGRAMELGRECLELWGYKRVEEVIWVKTNQLQRIIRTGRTGHWLNHSKEHCLVGIKGNPVVNRNIDTDVLVAEVRETSRKPDEMYPLLERISPRTRKLELFARMHNTHAGWMSLGNQLDGVRLVDEGLRARFKAAYPEVEVKPQSPPRVVTPAFAPVEVDNPYSGADAPVRHPESSQDKPMNMDVEMC